ncbi:tetratricopeptide repeat protein [Alistipes sp.]|uniref:tetratricopeptide repeat protein n=1 Tax=Alistipes sp. TaxID=1872444 RepID=UPI003AEF60E9
MYRLLYILLLFIAAGARAQQQPERSQVRKGNRQYHKGDYETAIERYTRALTVSPQSFEAAYDLGNALYKAERFDHAEQTMQRAAADSLRSDTERAEAFYNLGNAQFKQQKYKEALESYKQSLRLNPSDMEAKYNYAYTKRLLDEDQQGGGGDNQQDQQDQQDRQQDRQNQQQDRQGDGQEKPGDQDRQQGDGQDEQSDPEDNQQGEPQPVEAGLSEEEQQQILDAIQAREDKTQEKLKEKQGVVVRGRKNW